MRTDWWKRFFKSSGFPLADEVRVRDTETEIRKLLKLLPLPRGAKVIDVGCGIGRHSVLLARRGYHVTGVDYSPSYLREARSRAGGQRPRFLRRDMRALGFENEFDAAINLWTSFGYFLRPSEDLRVLRSIHRALKPGGRLAIELINGAGLLRKGPGGRLWERRGRYWVLEEWRVRRGVDCAVLGTRIYIDSKGRSFKGETFVRLYDRRRLDHVMRRAGFGRIRYFTGLLEQGPGNRQPRRLLAVAQKIVPSTS